MKHTTLLFAALALPATAQLNIPSDGSDGAFAPTADIEIDLGQAITGTWSDDNAGSDIGKGIYDPAQWAVVFEYSSINIPVGVTVTFKNHPSNPPVIWLVSGNVTIDGTVDLQGQSAISYGLESLVPNLGGPGGFRGGPAGPDGRGDGLGPGGGGTNTTADTSNRPTYRSGNFEYGNPSILPLIGGSGGQANDALLHGSGGGGALLLAANQIELDGLITCRGGNTFYNGGITFGENQRGSGGAVRIIAQTLSGEGSISCLGGRYAYSGPTDTNFLEEGSEGRIRIEANNFSEVGTFPETVAVPTANPPLIFPPANAATVRIVSVSNSPAPADPTAPLQSTSDIAIQNNGPVTITLQTTNFPLEGVVQVRVAEKFGNASYFTATNTGGNIASATWELSRTFADGFTTLQARATAP